MSGQTIAPLPSSYTMDNLLSVFGFTRQNLYQTGLLDHIVRYSVSGERSTRGKGGSSTSSWVYDAESVMDWEKRLARRRILVEWGLLSGSAALLNAPADGKRETILACLPQSKQALLLAATGVEADLDTQCPKCGQFALRHPGQPGRVRCEAGHDTGEPRAVVTRRRRAPRKSPR